MMYNNKLSACIKVNGKVLRELGEDVFIPFGSEYTISIKNHNSVRASVTVEIDGVDATGNYSLVINPNDTVELKRFITNGNMTTGNAFKFIERTTSIEQHRGIKQDDGLIRISFAFEIPKPQLLTHDVRYLLSKQISGNAGFSGQLGGNSTFPGGDLMNVSTFADDYSLGSVKSFAADVSNVAYASNSVVRSYAPQSDVGITVPGNVTEQSFKTVNNFATESQTSVLVIHLRGETSTGTQVITPITVKTKPVCTTCGKTNKVTSKFCSECGTSLTII